jgi:hypothetical protein
VVCSEAFKKQVVREFEKGLVSKDQLKRKYDIKSNSAVLKWFRKYGKFVYAEPASILPVMKDSHELGETLSYYLFHIQQRPLCRNLILFAMPKKQKARNTEFYELLIL